MTYDSQALDQGWDSLHDTGPEYEGWLSNHGPMVVEALSRRGRGELVEAWVAEYRTRLNDAPSPGERITEETWREALGDPRRLGDWPGWFNDQLAERPWEQVLATWWPRLLPGIAAGATHGVIRVGHAVQGLRLLGPSPARLLELAQALAYWAARWQQVPVIPRVVGRLSPSAELARVPRIADQSGGIRARLTRLDNTPGWSTGPHPSFATERPESLDFLREVVVAAVAVYADYGRASPVMLVHGVTAPNAVLRVLPALPEDLWWVSAEAAWSATAAVVAAYAPETGRAPSGSAPRTPEDALDEAVHNRDEHAIKFVDTALDVYQWTGSDQALAAARVACEAIVD